MTTQKTISQGGLFTQRDLEFIGRARRVLMARHHLDDDAIAKAIASKKSGWAETAVGYQITILAKDMPNPKPSSVLAWGFLGC